MQRIYFQTFGCKANQYDTERMRQELEARGGHASESWTEAEVCVVNTCTVTNQADAEARRFIRRVRRENPDLRVVVAGCSAALRAEEYAAMDGVTGVVKGHDPVEVAQAAQRDSLVQIGLRRTLDRKCAFCATRLARGVSRSREPDEVIAEARLLAGVHPELVITGIHIGHYGHDLPTGSSLGGLMVRLLDEIPDVRFRLGSVEATEIDDALLETMAGSGGRLVPHLHMPLQSGADPVLRRMRRWHTREQYRRRTLEIAERLPALGLGADVITGFPGETEEDHGATRSLIEELPFTYLHVFPFSPRDGTVASELQREMPVPQRVAGERSRDLRELVQGKGEAYRATRVGDQVTVVLEAGGMALTEDYLRASAPGGLVRDRRALHSGILRMKDRGLYIDLNPDPHIQSPGS